MVGGWTDSGRSSSKSSIMIAGAEKLMWVLLCRKERRGRVRDALPGKRAAAFVAHLAGARLESWTGPGGDLIFDDSHFAVHSYFSGLPYIKCCTILTAKDRLFASAYASAPAALIGGGAAAGRSTSPRMSVLGTDTVSAALCGQAWGMRSSRPRRDG